MASRRITSRADIDEGLRFLGQHDPRFLTLSDQTGPLPLRLKDEGFQTLFNAIVSQQVSVASADAIWRRLEAAGMIDPAAILAASDDALRACGLSRPKVKYARSLAQEDINYKGLRDLPDAEVTARLVAVKGIGRWSAEIYLMFSLGRVDVFAAGDLALQEAARVFLDLDKRPSEALMRQLAEQWSPWRAVAARALWAYYRVIKSREGIS